MARLNSSRSLWLLATYIKGQTAFPELSYVVLLDDIRVMYYNGELKTLNPRGNTTTEEDVGSICFVIGKYLKFCMNTTLKCHLFIKGVLALQQLVVCELKDDGEPGQMITRSAFRGSTISELLYVDKKFTYQVKNKCSHLYLPFFRPIYIEIYNDIFLLPFFFPTVKPKVRLLQKELSSGFHVSCLATGFYPRHINLTLFRDEQPVADHEITGGDLLPNADGTYQMRKSLEIRAADKHKYTCSATHLSLDNKLDVTLGIEFDSGEPFKSVIPSVLIVLALVLMFGTGLIIYKCRRRRLYGRSKRQTQWVWRQASERLLLTEK
uniref:Major histocompatibility complex class I LDA n=1 Tax=Sinocyclocheilus rhinocerous TaxID=307959 RepID=A0A673LAV6_9TELE